ncbi:ovomucoid-like [Crocuta crocuta]
MSFFLIWIKAIFIIALVFPHYSETGFEPAEPHSFPKCAKYISQPSTCQNNMDPVCASNGKTYSTMCEFCSDLFRTGGAIAFRHYGECPSA